MLYRLTVFKPAMTSWKGVGIRYLYEKLFPFLSGRALTAIPNKDTIEFISPPKGNDKSGINCILESVRYLARSMGKLEYKESLYYTMLIKYDMLNTIKADLETRPDILEIELDALNIAIRHISKCTAEPFTNSETNKSHASSSQLANIMNTIDNVQQLIADIDKPRCTIPPKYQLQNDVRINDICENPWFGRLRRDTDVDALAGSSPSPPIMRPIEMTLVPESVSDFQEVACAMRHALDLCVLLANQSSIVRNSYTLRLCLIEHLLIRVIPLPLPLLHPERDSFCFWHAQDMRQETQADILRLLNLLCRHFATASLSVKVTRSGDAIRMLVFSAFATICDAVLRKVACDMPAYTSLHYSGRALGPLRPFGFELGNFAEESEYLKFCCPEATAARTQILDYFNDIRKVVTDDHMMFRFEVTNEISVADKTFIDQIALHLGYKRQQELAYITGINPVMLVRIMYVYIVCVYNYIV